MPTQIRLVVDDKSPYEFFAEIDAVVARYRVHMVLQEQRRVTVDPLIVSFSDTQDELLNSHIRNLGLSTRVTNCLLDRFKKNDSIRIVTIGDLIRYSATDLLSIKGIGKEAIAEIRRALDDRVLCLKGEESPDYELEG